MKLASIVEKLQHMQFNTQTRLLFAVIFLIAAIFAPVLGVLLLRADVAEAQQLREEILADFERTNDPRFIFGNNLYLTLIMFVPIIGPIWGFFVLFNTGSIIALISIARGFPPILTYLLLFLIPVFWLEFAAYSFAMAQSMILFLRILQHKGKQEGTKTCIVITLCTLILLIAAIIEWFIIKETTFA
ncbi:MAG: stage II sporulation protein M [Candidatus Bathyarchaeota archaeon]|nr:stage II sporulation protein M [Candidatus Bathyarchaeota archaeon]